MVLCGSLWFFVLLGVSWCFLMVFGGFWQFLWFFVVLCGSWWFLMIFNGSLVVCGGCCWFLVVLGGSGWFLVVLGSFW